MGEQVLDSENHGYPEVWEWLWPLRLSVIGPTQWASAGERREVEEESHCVRCVCNSNIFQNMLTSCVRGVPLRVSALKKTLSVLPKTQYTLRKAFSTPRKTLSNPKTRVSPRKTLPDRKRLSAPRKTGL